MDKEGIEKLCYELYEKLGTEKTVKIKIMSKDVETRDIIRLGNMSLKIKRIKSAKQKNK